MIDIIFYVVIGGIVGYLFFRYHNKKESLNEKFVNIEDMVKFHQMCFEPERQEAMKAIRLKENKFYDDHPEIERRLKELFSKKEE